MRRVLILAPMVLALLGAGAIGQGPQHGDIVLSCYGPSYTTGALLYFTPGPSATLTTFNTLARNNVPVRFHNWVRMAPDNTDLVVAEVIEGSSDLLCYSPSGSVFTIVTNISGDFTGFELDGDDTWVVAAHTTHLYGVQQTSRRCSTFSLAGPLPAAYNEIAILRERGHKYVIANFTTATSTLNPVAKIYTADRNGLTGTLLATAPQPCRQMSGIEVDPKTGDLITTDFDGLPDNDPSLEVNRVSLATSPPTVTTVGSFRPNGCKVGQDDTVWVGGYDRTISGRPIGVRRFDLGTNVVLQTMLISNNTPGWSVTAVEIYGSHPLTVNKLGATMASINLQSHHPLAPGANYQLACSFARRPARSPSVRFPNGEWLHLDVTDSLFFLTAVHAPKAWFTGFSGTLSTFGRATAQITLPKSFPANLGITVFCAGIIYNQQAVLQVTNTHWFEL